MIQNDLHSFQKWCITCVCYFSIALTIWAIYFCGSLTVHGPDALEALEVPEFDGHVCWAGSKQLSSLIKGDVLHRVCMTLQSSLKVSCFIVPHLHTDTDLRNVSRSSVMIFIYSPVPCHLMVVCLQCRMSINRSVIKSLTLHGLSYSNRLVS